jgi:glycosyltransferase involved in cell wall biosynthesis
MDVAVLARSLYPSRVASARVRVAGHAQRLGEHGVDLRFRPALDDEEYGMLTSTGHFPAKGLIGVQALARSALRQTAGGLQMVHRLALPMRVPGLEPARRLDVYDFDDALTVGSIHPANRRLNWLKQERLRAATYMRRARLVIAGSPHLAGLAREHAWRVEIVPSCVDPAAQPLREHAERETLTVGWIGSPTTSGYLGELLDVVGQLVREGVGLRLVVIGAELDASAPWLEQRPWSLEREHEELARFDIGVMPLPDDPWTRGKCGYKLLQCYAAGVPVVASPVGVNAEILEAGGGLPATTRDEWLDGLRRLAGDVRLRAELGAAGRTVAETRYSYDVWTPRLAELLRELGSR